MARSRLFRPETGELGFPKPQDVRLDTREPAHVADPEVELIRYFRLCGIGLDHGFEHSQANSSALGDGENRSLTVAARKRSPETFSAAASPALESRAQRRSRCGWSLHLRRRMRPRARVRRSSPATDAYRIRTNP